MNEFSQFPADPAPVDPAPTDDAITIKFEIRVPQGGARPAVQLGQPPAAPGRAARLEPPGSYFAQAVELPLDGGLANVQVEDYGVDTVGEICAAGTSFDAGMGGAAVVVRVKIYPDDASQVPIWHPANDPDIRETTPEQAGGMWTFESPNLIPDVQCGPASAPVWNRLAAWSFYPNGCVQLSVSRFKGLCSDHTDCEFAPAAQVVQAARAAQAAPTRDCGCGGAAKHPPHPQPGAGRGAGPAAGPWGQV